VFSLSYRPLKKKSPCIKHGGSTIAVFLFTEIWQHSCSETRIWLNLLVSIHGYFCINFPYLNISVVHNMAIFQDPCIETGRLKIIRDLYTYIFQDPCIETRRFSGDADNFHDKHTDIFEDPCSETRRCKKRWAFYFHNILGLYTQILSRSVFRNTEM